MQRTGPKTRAKGLMNVCQEPSSTDFKENIHKNNKTDKCKFRIPNNRQIKQVVIFDSNMNNNLVEQRKILHRKIFELDAWIHALKDYGYTLFLGIDLQKKRDVENIAFNNKIVGMSSEKKASFQKNYTPITTF